MKTAISSVYLILAVISPALAANTAASYNNGVLANVFMGFCALVVVSQLVPALILFLGFIKACAQRKNALESESATDKS